MVLPRRGKTVRFGSGQLDLQVKRVIFKRVNRVVGRVKLTHIFQTSFFFFFFQLQKKKSMTTYLERMNKIN